uniref:NADH dehydrogenase subunit 6 n=1 Tax=Arma koreana TaxID=1603581 RepID=UPI002E77069B|nr:NADH dehydrogenase subunit 6 [Arma koreana]WPM93267.1 NADH dehydrogenase subunit 6 [Arma koreana]
MMNMMMSLMITVSLILLTLNHPLSMGLILIMQTLITSTVIGYMLGSFFFSYIIIIIMLFIYMASMVSNMTAQLMYYYLFIIYNIVFQMLHLMHCFETIYQFDEVHIVNGYVLCYCMSLIKIFNMTAQLTVMMIIYLSFTMIVVSNIAKTNEGPLRMKN